MAIYTKYGIPLDGASPRDTAIQPKLKFKFRVRFVNFGGLESASYSFDATQQVLSVARPKISFTPVEMGTYAGKIKVFNKPTFENISLRFRDDMANKLAEALGSQLQRQYDFNEGRYAVSSGSAKFTMFIETLDGINDLRSIDAFKLEGCFIQTIDFGEFNYTESTGNEISMDISYDYLGGYYSEKDGIESARQLLWYVTTNPTSMATSNPTNMPQSEEGLIDGVVDGAKRIANGAANSIGAGINTATDSITGFFGSDDE